MAEPSGRMDCGSTDSIRLIHESVQAEGRVLDVLIRNGCESGFTNFYFRLNDGSEHLIKRVANDFLDSEESKDLSNYTPESQQLIMWDLMGLL